MVLLFGEPTGNNTRYSPKRCGRRPEFPVKLPVYSFFVIYANIEGTTRDRLHAVR